ncbi:YkyA family protein [Macrococcus armenti]|uniref:YkyA family protein n=1 Tax=Macrococcus armenti TaxID=2875764 RepID=UPI001CCAD74F|nr:YkyA family protein [Macrococcus armenti]UBH09398.1 YkyA family protein [Macrococcus armenti]
MKIVKLFLAGMLALFLAACNNTEALERFATDIDKSVKAESQLQDIGPELQKLESEKVEVFNTLEKTTPEKFRAAADKLLKNTEERSKLIEQEIKAMEHSQEIYESSKSKTKDIEDEQQKKTVMEFIKVNDNKFKKHNDLMNSYKEILKAEKEVFTHMKEPQPDMKNINKKIEVVTKKYETFHKDTNSYANLLKVVNNHKEKITDILNGK